MLWFIRNNLGLDQHVLNDFSICISDNLGLDQRAFNALSVSRDSAMWDISVRSSGGQIHNIGYGYSCYDPL